MEQNMKEQEKSADENDIVCNGRFVCHPSHLSSRSFLVESGIFLLKCIYVLFALNIYLKLTVHLYVVSIPADVEEVRGESKEEKRKAPKQKKVQLTDRDYEEMPTENLDWEKISAEEKERMKDWARRKEKELVEQASELQFRLLQVFA